MRVVYVLGGSVRFVCFDKRSTTKLSQPSSNWQHRCTETWHVQKMWIGLTAQQRDRKQNSTVSKLFSLTKGQQCAHSWLLMNSTPDSPDRATVRNLCSLSLMLRGTVDMGVMTPGWELLLVWVCGTAFTTLWPDSDQSHRKPGKDRKYNYRRQMLLPSHVV